MQDEAEADGGGLRVPEALLRDADGGEPAAAQGAGGAARAQGGAALLHAAPGHHPVHVPLLRARRLRAQPCCLHLGTCVTVIILAACHSHRHRRRRTRRARRAPAALVIRRAVRGHTQLHAGIPASAAGAGTGQQLLVNTRARAPSPSASPSLCGLVLVRIFGVSEAVRRRRVDGWDARSGGCWDGAVNLDLLSVYVFYFLVKERQVFMLSTNGVGFKLVLSLV